MSKRTKKNEAAADTIPSGYTLDYVSGNQIKESKKELVRQRVVRALIHEYGFSPDDMALDFKVAGRKRVDIAIFHHGTDQVVENLGRAAICRPEPKVGKNAVRIRDFEQAAKDLDEIESIMREVDSIQYGLWTNGLEFFFVEKEQKRFETKCNPIGDWPMAEESVGTKDVLSDAHTRVADNEMLKITFRRCHLWALDWWGDTAAAYVRVENETMPERPDVVFEDCTMVSPQCALKVGNYGFTTSSHVSVSGCRLIALNFSQPHGTPTDGLIQSVERGRYLHVDVEDSTLMGYRVFGVTVAKDTVDEIQYMTRGAVQAYVQFQQEVPDGMHRLGHWPADLFADLVPRPPARRGPALRREGVVHEDLCELSPILWRERLCHLECVRPGGGGETRDYYLRLRDAETGRELARIAEGYGLASACVAGDRLHVFASQWLEGTWNHVTQFSSDDLEHWTVRRVTEQQPDEHLFNTSVCAGPEGYVLAYESNDPAYPPFTVKFAHSTDLETWEEVPEAIFGTDRYTACPCIRYEHGFYYMLYLEHRGPRHWFETYIARSPDLVEWELSSANPVLRAEGLDEGVNASDPELVEVDGRTWVYFAVGDQLTWMKMKRAAYDGSQRAFLEAWFEEPGIADRGSGPVGGAA